MAKSTSIAIGASWSELAAGLGPVAKIVKIATNQALKTVLGMVSIHRLGTRRHDFPACIHRLSTEVGAGALTIGEKPVKMASMLTKRISHAAPAVGRGLAIIIIR